MKILVAVVMGGCSGFLIYLMGGLLFLTCPNNQWMPIAIVLLFGGWAASTYGLLRNAMTVWEVAARGFLLGALEWLLMVVVGIVRPPVVGRGILSAVVIGGASVLMAVACLTGYAIVRRRELPDHLRP